MNGLRIDRTGLRYGPSVVIKYLPNHANGSKEMWLCQCDCGKIVEKHAASLRQGTGCGCMRSANSKLSGQKKKIYGKRTVNKAYGEHCISSELRNLAPMPYDIWWEMSQKNCHYCGNIDNRNSLTSKQRLSKPEEEISRYSVEMNGVDRLDSSLGYLAENCVPCCYRCNEMKNAMSLKSFILKVNDILNQKNSSDYPVHIQFEGPKANVTIRDNFRYHANRSKTKNRKPLAEQEWRDIVFKGCNYCGKIDTRTLSWERVEKSCSDKSVYDVLINGIDRIDSSLGYIRGNVVAACRDCNVMKNNHTPDEFYSRLNEIWDYMGRSFLSKARSRYKCVRVSTTFAPAVPLTS